MKKFVIFALALVFVLSALAGCGSGSEKLSDAKTLGDIFAMEDAGTIKFITAGSANDKYAFGFSLDGVLYRAIATLPDDVREAYYNVDYSQENYADAEDAILSPVAIETIENLSEKIPAQKDLDQWVGKTGEEMFGGDWWSTFSDLEGRKADVINGYFCYSVTFEGEFELPEDYDADDILKTLTVKSVTFNTIGDITAGLVTETE